MTRSFVALMVKKYNELNVKWQLEQKFNSVVELRRLGEQVEP